METEQYGIENFHGNYYVAAGIPGREAYYPNQTARTGARLVFVASGGLVLSIDIKLDRRRSSTLRNSRNIVRRWLVSVFKCEARRLCVEREAETEISVKDSDLSANIVFTSVPTYVVVKGRVVVESGAAVPQGLRILMRNKGPIM